MFRDIIQPAAGVGGRKKYVVPLSILTHVILIAIAIAFPLFAPGVLPSPATTLIARVNPVIPDVPLPPPPPASQPRTPPPAPTPDPSVAPIDAPHEIAPEPARFPATQIGVESVGTIEGVDASVSDLFGKRVEPVPPPRQPAPPAEPLHVGGKIKQPRKINDIQPIYPPIAQQAHVEGMVIIEATLGPGGNVVDARVLKSIPLLNDAALAAVRQWRYTPTLLNGIPVPVVMTVTVNFTLR
jgi:protein TonB